MRVRRSDLLKADSVKFSYATADQPVLTRAVIKTLEFVGGQRKLKKRYLEGRAAVARGEGFFDMAVRMLALDVIYDRLQLAKVPKDGPVLFVANHPFGVLDGVILSWLAAKVRPDVKVLAAGVLCALPEAREQLLPIDFAETREAQETTLKSRIAAQKWLQTGHAIGIFPAGGISTTEKPLEGPALDLPWAPFTGKLAMGSKATVVPIYFEGQNSRLFQLASHMSMTLRYSLLFRETAKRMGKRIVVRIGDPIPCSEWSAIKEREPLVAEFRRRTFLLAPLGGGELMRNGRLKIYSKPAPLRSLG
ncbi:MAG: lysophospholipid acyltransferase family protein [Ancalomicrobiaceae bacterium]|nr:lysophospholipid acyltransferase family protein [Ancalomicrobiaceae bacterium]